MTYLPSAGGELFGLREGGAVDADHGFAEVFTDFGEFFGIFVEQHGFDDGAGAFGGVAAFEDSAADEDGFGTELHHESGVGGGGDSARAEVGDGEFAEFFDFADEIEGGLVLFGEDEEFIFAGVLHSSDFGYDCAHVSDGFDHVAGASFAFGADHCGAFGASAEGFAEVARAAYEWDGESVFIDVVGVVGGGEDFAFVDEVDFKCFEDLGFDEVADAAFCHDGDGDGGFDLEDHFGVGHSCDSAIFADVGGDSFEGHDGDGPGIFGDAGLFWVDDIHDDAAFEHFGEADFFSPCFGGGG